MARIVIPWYAVRERIERLAQERGIDISTALDPTRKECLEGPAIESLFSEVPPEYHLVHGERSYLYVFESPASISELKALKLDAILRDFSEMKEYSFEDLTNFRRRIADLRIELA